MVVFIWVRKFADYFDRLFDSLTTFRLLLYILLGYLATAVAFATNGNLGFSAYQLILSCGVLVAGSKLMNLCLAHIFKIPANHESDIITGLILVFILSPAKDSTGYLLLAAIAAVAMASKYVLTLRGRHIFNPAALGAAVAGLIFHEYPSWWIGNTHMAPFLLIGGLLIVRKMRRFELVATFSFVYLFYIFVFLHINLAAPGSWHNLYLYLAATPLLFFATIMLTEPITSPNREQNLIIFAVFVGILYSIVQLRRPPEEALLIGNILAFGLEPNRSLLLKLIAIRREAAGIFSFVFSLPPRFSFQAGQYMEWTLPHTAIDARGNRRYLTIASAPTEKNLMFTVKIPAHHSKFKDSLMALKPGQKIAATRLAGSFILKNNEDKVAFIAGGVGITPFRSIIKDLMERGKRCDVRLFYSVNTAGEIAFQNLLSEASSVGVHTSYVVTKGDEPDYLHGYIDADLIKNNLPDYKERVYYISGPQGFVAAVRLALLGLGVNAKQITTDFFPGYN